MSAEPGRDELISARAARDQLKKAAMASAKAIGVLMEDRVRHMAALRQIAVMGNSGYYVSGSEFRRVAVEALEAETDMSWWPDEIPAAAGDPS